MKEAALKQKETVTQDTTTFEKETNFDQSTLSPPSSRPP